MKLGDQIVVIPSELVAGGDSLTRVDGMPVFVPNLYPGDEALIRVTEVKRGFARGKLVEILRAGALRRAMPCPVAEECGGCDWTALQLDHQLEAKRRILAESLRRIGKMDAAALPPIVLHASPLNYRLRSRLHIQNGLLGFFEAGTHRVVPLPDECEVVGAEVIRRLPELRKAAQRTGSGEMLTLESAHGFRTGADATLTIEAGGFRYKISTDTFFQVNRHLLGTLIDLVLACAVKTRRRGAALDLFSGVGFFTVPLSTVFDEVTGVEESPMAHRLATENGAGYPKARFVEQSVEEFLRHSPQEVDFVLVDPPRAGVAPLVLDAISDTYGEILCYLSCDPVTFSRDVLRLARRGWILTSLDLVDLFPNTHHVETFASFRREGSGTG